MTTPPNASFTDVRTATKNLRTLQEVFITSGSRVPPDRFSSLLEEHLRSSPDPDLLLAGMIRFTETSLNRAALFNDLVEYPVLMQLLAVVFGSSRYFADVLVRDPELFRWLTTSDSLANPRSAEFFGSEVERVLGVFARPERALDALKRIYRREILRIGVRDLLGEADVATVTSEISSLADALIRGCWTLAARSLAERFPSAPGSSWTVIALGKLGGHELNYSSDIDLMVVFEDDGEFADGRGNTTTHHEYFTRLTERAVQYLSDSSAEGHLYRVDMRLRPDGNAGPLARSAPACLLYYESRGEQWERQMLLKARPVAGDPTFGASFLGRLDPFVFPRSLLRHPAVEVARLKARIEAGVGGEENVKLCAGGIRDIEFTIQTLQLLQGGRRPEVRSGNTLAAIGMLERAGLLNAAGGVVLRDAYVFFRTVEHRLQMMENTQTHLIPTDERGRRSLARRCGLPSAEEFGRVYKTHRTAVRRMFDAVLAVPAGREDLTIAAVIDGGVAEHSLTTLLSSYGMKDPKGALRTLSSLLRGSSLSGGREPDGRAREAFRRVAGLLFDDIARTPLPDRTLANLAMLAAGQSSPGQFYEELGSPGFRKLVLGVCATSGRFARALAGHPLQLEELSLSVAPRDRARPGRAGWREEKTAGEIRAGVRSLLGIASLEETSAELAMLADDIVTGVFEELRTHSRRRSVPLALFALGKYGTCELSFDADLDMIAVSGSMPADRRAEMERLVATLVSTLAEGGLAGYDLDFRLRPEGKSAPLVIDRGAYRTYLARRASLWERQSLTRLRFVCGDAALGSAVMAEILAFVYASPLPANWIDEVVEMRRRMETRSRIRASEYLDVKLGAGGMVDVEFTVQMMLLASGRDGARWHAHPTVRVLKEHPGTFLEARERDSLVAAYRFYRNVERMIRIVLEERSSVLPEHEKLDQLAGCMDGSAGPDLHDRCAAMMRSTRTLFLRFAERLRDHPQPSVHR